MKKSVLLIFLVCVMFGFHSCNSRGGDNNSTETKDLTENESETDTDEENYPSEEEEAYSSEEEDIDVGYEESHYTNGGYNEVGTLGTMQLEYAGFYGTSESNPMWYIGKAGRFKNYEVYHFSCMPYSRYGKDDIASFDWCAYDNEEGEEEYSVSVPSEVILDGRSYRVERVQLQQERYSHGAKRYILPSTIKQMCFRKRTHLSEVILNEGIREISDEAFMGCKDLEKVVIPSSVKRIGSLAFYGCLKLKELYIPSSVTDIGEGAAIIDLEDVLIKVEEGCHAFESLKAKRLQVRHDHHYEYFDFDPAKYNIQYVNSTNYNEE